MSTINDNDDTTISKERAKSAFRYTEEIGPGLKLDMSLSKIHHTTLCKLCYISRVCVLCMHLLSVFIPSLLTPCNVTQLNSRKYKLSIPTLAEH